MYGHDEISQAIEGRSPNSTGWIRVNCPLCHYRGHSRDDGASLGAHHETGYFRCFRCDAAGRLKYVEQLDTAYEPITRETFDLPREAAPLFVVDTGEISLATGALAYMIKERRFTHQHLIQSMAHFAAQGGWEGRIIFPHYYKETLWGWTGRSYTGLHELPKRYPAGMSREMLYNQEVTELKTDKPCLIVESITSSLRYLPHAVACLGQPTNSHFNTLSLVKTRPLIVVLDGDHYRDCRRFARELRYAGCNAKAILLPAGSDPDSAYLASGPAVDGAIKYLVENSDVEVDLMPSTMVEVE